MRKFLLSLFAIIGFFLLHAQETPKPDSLQEYTGKYKFPEGSEVTEIKVVLENGALYANSDKGNSELRKIEKDVFEVVSYTGTATFKRNDTGKVYRVYIEVGNMILDGTKDESSTQSLSKFRLARK